MKDHHTTGNQYISYMYAPYTISFSHAVCCNDTDSDIMIIELVQAWSYICAGLIETV